MKEESLCGYAPFTLPKTHEFYPVCKFMHDPAYENYLKGFYGRPLHESDRAMLRAFLEIAKEKESFRLRVEAYIFYGLTTAFRLVFRS